MHKSCPLTTELVGPRNRHSRARTRPPSRAAQWAKGSIATRSTSFSKRRASGLSGRPVTSDRASHTAEKWGYLLSHPNWSVGLQSPLEIASDKLALLGTRTKKTLTSWLAAQVQNQPDRFVSPVLLKYPFRSACSLATLSTKQTTTPDRRLDAADRHNTWAMDSNQKMKALVVSD